MKVVIELQEAFSGHYAVDKFEASLNWIYSDLMYAFKINTTVSGSYELELYQELMRAILNSYQIDDDSDEEIDEVFNLKKQVEKEKVEDGYYSY